jgi:AcrR family transcriptional regulator
LRPLRFHVSAINIKVKVRRKRAYRQATRALFAEETGQRILAAFGALAQAQWYDEVTLEAVASAADVTVQTVIRRFGGKVGLLDAWLEHISSEISARRVPERPGITSIVGVVVDDYEHSGDAVLRMLLQESRWPVVRALVERGRVAHRRWVTQAFSSLLEGSPAARRSLIDGLVVATDVYTWKLLRRDMRRSVHATKAMMLRLVRGVLQSSKGEVRDG